RGEARGSGGVLGGADEDRRGELEHLASVHLQEMLLPGRHRARAASGVVELRPAAPVGAELEREEPALADGLEYHRARTVAKQDEGRAVGPVEDLREDVPADPR